MTAKRETRGVWRLDGPISVGEWNEAYEEIKAKRRAAWSEHFATHPQQPLPPEPPSSLSIIEASQIIYRERAAAWGTSA